MTITEARDLLDFHAAAGVIGFVTASEGARIMEANNIVTDDYDARREAAAAAVVHGMAPAKAARKFAVPIGFCRNVARDYDEANAHYRGGSLDDLMDF